MTCVALSVVRRKIVLHQAGHYMWIQIWRCLDPFHPNEAHQSVPLGLRWQESAFLPLTIAAKVDADAWWRLLYLHLNVHVLIGLQFSYVACASNATGMDVPGDYYSPWKVSPLADKCHYLGSHYQVPIVINQVAANTLNCTHWYRGMCCSLLFSN